MRRREFITGISGAAIAWPHVVRAQQSINKIRLVAVLSPSNSSADESYIMAFRGRLADLGWQEGRNVQIEVRFSESDISRSRSLAAELLALTPDVLLATNTLMVQLI